MNAVLVPEVVLNHRQAEDLLKQLTHERDRLKLLLAVNNAVVSSLSLLQLFRAIPASVRRAMQCDATCLSLPEGANLRIHGLDFPRGNGFMREEILLPIEGSSPGQAFRSGKPVIFNNAVSSLDPLALRLNSSLEFQAGCYIPIIKRQQTLGVLHLLDRREHAFSSIDVEFLAQMAAQVAIALGNALEYREVSEARERLAEDLQRKNLSAPVTLASAQREHILQTLREARWVLGGDNGAAKRLGIPRTTLIYKMRRLGITRQPGEFSSSTNLSNGATL